MHKFGPGRINSVILKWQCRTLINGIRPSGLF